MRFPCMIVTVFMVAACAQQPAGKEPTQFTPPQPAQEVGDARTRAQLHTELGASYFEIGQYGTALEELNIALKADAGYAPVYNVLGLVYMELREDAAAEQNFLRALRLDPLDSDANNNYGWFLCQRNKEEAAIKFFLAALKNPLYRTADKSYVNAGICARRKGDDATAEEFFLRALRARPNQPQALYQMADMAFKRSNFAESREYIGRLSQTGTKPTAEVLWLALRVERRLGDRAAEASYGLQLRRNFPDSREARALINGQYE